MQGESDRRESDDDVDDDGSKTQIVDAISTPAITTVKDMQVEEKQKVGETMHGIKKQLGVDLFDYTIVVPANFLPKGKYTDELQFLRLVCNVSHNSQDTLKINKKSAIDYFTLSNPKKISLCLLPKYTFNPQENLALELVKSKPVIHYTFPRDKEIEIQFQSKINIQTNKFLEEAEAEVAIRGECKISGRSTGNRFSSAYEYTIDMSEDNIEFSKKQIEQIKNLIENNFKRVYVNGKHINKYLNIKRTFNSCTLHLLKKNLVLKITQSNPKESHIVELNVIKPIFTVYTNQEIDGIKLGKSYAKYLATHFKTINNNDDDDAHDEIITLPRRFEIFWILLLRKFDKKEDGKHKMRYDVDLKKNARKMYHDVSIYLLDRKNSKKVSKNDLKLFLTGMNHFDQDIYDMTWEILKDPNQKVEMTARIRNYIGFGGKTKNDTIIIKKKLYKLYKKQSKMANTRTKSRKHRHHPKSYYFKQTRKQLCCYNRMKKKSSWCSNRATDTRRSRFFNKCKRIGNSF